MAVVTAARAVQASASGTEAPSARRVSTPARSSSARSITRRPVTEVATIAPPIRIPPIGTSSRGRVSNAPEARSGTSATAAPPAIAATARDVAWRVPRIRRPEVYDAAPSMTATKAQARPACSKTSATIAPTAVSCTAARAPVTASSRSSPIRVTADSAIAATTSAAATITPVTGAPSGRRSARPARRRG